MYSTKKIIFILRYAKDLIFQCFILFFYYIISLFIYAITACQYQPTF